MNQPSPPWAQMPGGVGMAILEEMKRLAKEFQSQEPHCAEMKLGESAFSWVDRLISNAEAKFDHMNPITHKMGIKIVVDKRLPDNAIIARDQHGEVMNFFFIQPDGSILGIDAKEAMQKLVRSKL